jgi:hypothetical protein
MLIINNDQHDTVYDSVTLYQYNGVTLYYMLFII